MSVERRSGRRQEWLVVKTNDEKETGRCWSARLGGGEGKTSHFCFREEILVMCPALVEPGGKGLQNLTEKLVSNPFNLVQPPIHLHIQVGDGPVDSGDPPTQQAVEVMADHG